MPVTTPGDEPVEAFAAPDGDSPGRLTLDAIEDWAARMRAAGSAGPEPAFAYVRNGRGVHGGRLTRLTSYPPAPEGPPHDAS